MNLQILRRIVLSFFLLMLLLLLLLLLAPHRLIEPPVSGCICSFRLPLRLAAAGGNYNTQNAPRAGGPRRRARAGRRPLPVATSSVSPSSPLLARGRRLGGSAMAAPREEFPSEIQEPLAAFEESLKSAEGALRSLMSVPRSELLQKLDPVEQAKLDLASAYTLNSMFWIYLITRGVNPKEHAVKQELHSQRLRGSAIRNNKRSWRFGALENSKEIQNAQQERERKPRTTMKCFGCHEMWVRQGH
uniref:Nuclear nucleic acid-binding protein C1D n=1 Tax=Callorhinchus milii TaxID=7868 RepID=A0A4W3K118_CALMI